MSQYASCSPPAMVVTGVVLASEPLPGAVNLRAYVVRANRLSTLPPKKENRLRPALRMSSTRRAGVVPEFPDGWGEFTRVFRSFCQQRPIAGHPGVFHSREDRSRSPFSEPSLVFSQVRITLLSSQPLNIVLCPTTPGLHRLTTHSGRYATSMSPHQDMSFAHAGCRLTEY